MPEPICVAVLDTNVLIKIAGARAPRMKAIRTAWQQKRFVLVASELTLQELERTLRYAKVQNLFGLSEDDIVEFTHEIRTVAVLTQDLYEVTRIQADPADNIILACALEANADYIVSEDRHLRDLKFYHGIQIISLDQFRQIIGV